MADKTTKELERIYTIPMRDIKKSPRNHRTDRAVRHVKSYLRRHMKAQDVWIDTTVNELLWERGMYRIPPRIRVRALKFDDGVVEVTLPEADVTTSLREAIKKRREEKAEEKEKKKEEKEEKGEEKPEEEKATGEEKPAAPKGEGKEEKPEAKPETKAEPKEEKPAPKAEKKEAPAKTEGAERPKKAETGEKSGGAKKKD